MEAFWKVLGKQFCAEKKLEYIEKKANDDGTNNTLMFEKTLCIINLDGSGSMDPRDPFKHPNTDYGKAVAGARTAVSHLQKNHDCP